MRRDEVLAPLDRLNAPQRRAVEGTEGPLLILAGPGSGKTRVLTMRMAFLMEEKGVDPWQIVAVTFTNRAAREMRERLERLVGVEAAKAMTIGTIHGLCARLLRREVDYLLRYGMTTRFTIYDRDDSLRAIRQAMSLVDLSEFQHVQQDPHKGPKPSDVLECLSYAKARMVSVERLAREATTDIQRIASRVWPLYDRLLRRNNALDFDDLLTMAEHCLRSQPERLRAYQERWAYFHVDEFQDCNLPQYRLMRWLAGGSALSPQGQRNLCVVGDDDQMIYSWRGASVELVQAFETDFPERQVVYLEQNYRSTRTIVEGALALVARNIQRKEKLLWTQNPAGSAITVMTAIDERAEAAAIAQELKALKGKQVLPCWKDAAILYRMNAQSRALEEQLRRQHIPYVVIGSRSFYERQEIKDMLAYLSLLVHPEDDLSVVRVINRPARKLGEATVRKLQAFAEKEGFSLLQAMARIERCPGLTANPRVTLRRFGQMIEELRATSLVLPLPELLDCVIEKTQYEEEFRRSEDIDRRANVEELRRVMEAYADDDPAQALVSFLEDTALQGAADTVQTGEKGPVVTEGREEDAVRLMTLHASKGSEFAVVAIIGLDEGSMPHSRATSREELEEERRLAYVGATRAKQRLYLCRAERRLIFGEWRETEASRFLAALPPTHVQVRDVSSPQAFM